MLARGQLGDALTHYHAAVGKHSTSQMKTSVFCLFFLTNFSHEIAWVSEGDPDNYLTYFKRGTVYLALGKAKFAINDFSKVLELKPDFTAARFQRGNVHLKLADYDSAERDLYDVVSGDAYCVHLTFDS